MKARWWVWTGVVGAAVITVFGLWATRPREVTDRVVTQSEMAEGLRALPYARWHPAAPGDSLEEGVLRHDPEHAFRGTNLYTLEDESIARLIDMDGDSLHQWHNERTDWHHVEMDPRGNLFVVGEEALVKMDWDSRTLWQVEGSFHHDLALGSDGKLFSLIRETRYVQRGGAKLPIIDDLIVIMNAGGEITNRISLWDLFHDSVDSSRLDRIAVMMKAGRRAENSLVREVCDVFHTNSIELLEHDIDGIARAGDLLISLREIDTVAIVRVQGQRVLWKWGQGQLVRQHHPSLLGNGNILIFDNRKASVGSRVIELNPRNGRIEWEYRTEDPKSFWSQRRGACQRLPNGNTLITESDNGRVFEVTREGTIVWELRSRVRKIKPRRIEREAIYRAMRVDPLILRNLPFTDTIRRRLDRQGYFDVVRPTSARRTLPPSVDHDRAAGSRR